MSFFEFSAPLQYIFNLPIRNLNLLGLSRNDKSSICLEFLASIVENQCYVQNLNANTTPRITEYKTGKILAETFPLVCTWFSENFNDNIALQNFCGRSKLERMAVRKGLHKCIEWSVNWNDFSTPASNQFENPLCGQRLLERMLRHQRLEYILQGQAGVYKGSHILTVVDIYLLTIVLNWLRNFSCEARYLLHTVPATISYVYRIRTTLRKLLLPASCYKLSIFDPIDWIDNSNIPYPLSNFHFTPSKQEQAVIKENRDKRCKEAVETRKDLRRAHGRTGTVLKDQSTLAMLTTVPPRALIDMVDWSLCQQTGTESKHTDLYLPSAPAHPNDPVHSTTDTTAGSFIPTLISPRVDEELHANISTAEMSSGAVSVPDHTIKPLTE